MTSVGPSQLLHSWRHFRPLSRGLCRYILLIFLFSFPSIIACVQEKTHDPRLPAAGGEVELQSPALGKGNEIACYCCGKESRIPTVLKEKPRSCYRRGRCNCLSQKKKLRSLLLWEGICDHLRRGRTRGDQEQ